VAKTNLSRTLNIQNTDVIRIDVISQNAMIPCQSECDN